MGCVCAVLHPSPDLTALTVPLGVHGDSVGAGEGLWLCHTPPSPVVDRTPPRVVGAFLFIAALSQVRVCPTADDGARVGRSQCS